MRMMRVARPLAVVLVLAALPSRAVRAQDASPTAPTRSTLDGVYSEEQATRGADTFQFICYECHETSEFTAKSFLGEWDTKAIYYLFKDILTLMPDDNPGALRSGDVVDVLAYIMKLNGMPAGDSALPDDREALRGIVMAVPKGGGPPAPLPVPGVHR